MERNRRQTQARRRPFWLPASSYYVLAAASALASFFLIWGILNEGSDEAPWIPAGLVASMILAGAVVVREIFLRNVRRRVLAAQLKLDRTMLEAAAAGRRKVDSEKLTLDRNSAILADIQRKSEAARVLSKLAESHREVFVLCDEYIAAAERELPSVGVGSPRIAAFNSGKKTASKIHRYHMLKWAEIEAKRFAKKAGDDLRQSERLAALHDASVVVETALAHYPDETSLLDSKTVLDNLAVSIKVAGLVGKAERAELKGHLERASVLYNEALSILDRGSSESEEFLAAKGRIVDEIDRIGRLTGPADDLVQRSSEDRSS